jgi:hypothetical protein
VNSAHSGSPRYVAILAVIASGILAVGWFARPREIPQSPPPVPSQTELQELARRTQRRSLETMTAYFADVASEVRRSLVSVQPAGVSGILWNETQVVTAPFLGEPGATMTIRAGDTVSSVVAVPASPRVPVSALNVPAPLTGPGAAPRAASLPQSGDWVVAVWLTGETKAFAPANFRHSVTTTCGVVTVGEVMTSLSLNRAMLGGGLFTMDGNLVALILPCGDRLAAIQTSAVAEMLKRAGMIEDRVLARWGILFSPLSDLDRPYFRDVDGLLVREVWLGTAGDAAGFRPGDVVTALNGAPVATLDDVRGLEVRTDVVFELDGRRGRSAHTWSLTSVPGLASTGVAPAMAGVVLEGPAGPYRIGSVVPGSRAERAGVRPGDRIVRIDGAEPRSRQTVERSLAQTAPAAMLLEIERDGRRIAVVIPAGGSR